MIKQKFKRAFQAQLQEIRHMLTAEIGEILAKCEMNRNFIWFVMWFES